LVNPTAFAAAPADPTRNRGRGDYPGTAFETWDISARKQFEINERFKLRFQADFFNIFNRANFRAPPWSLPMGALAGSRPPGPARNIQFV